MTATWKYDRHMSGGRRQSSPKVMGRSKQHLAPTRYGGPLRPGTCSPRNTDKRLDTWTHRHETMAQRTQGRQQAVCGRPPHSTEGQHPPLNHDGLYYLHGNAQPPQGFVGYSDWKESQIDTLTLQALESWIITSLNTILWNDVKQTKSLINHELSPWISLLNYNTRLMPLFWTKLGHPFFYRYWRLFDLSATQVKHSTSGNSCP